MGKKGGPGKGSTGNPASRGQVTLREETSGIKQNKGSSKNSKSALKLGHMQKLAVWASGEASIPSLGAYFGCRMAAVGEAMGVVPDPSMFPCQRCETVLQPAHNCTIRIKKNTLKSQQRRRHGSNSYTRNDVVFKCHFCSHGNLKRGTPKDYMKQICPPKDKQSSRREPANSQLRKCASSEKDTRRENETDKKMAAEIIPVVDSPATALPKTVVTLLDSKKKRRNRTGPKKPTEPESKAVSTDSEKSDSFEQKEEKILD